MKGEITLCGDYIILDGKTIYKCEQLSCIDSIIKNRCCINCTVPSCRHCCNPARIEHCIKHKNMKKME